MPRQCMWESIAVGHGTGSAKEEGIMRRRNMRKNRLTARENSCAENRKAPLHDNTLPFLFSLPFASCGTPTAAAAAAAAAA
jgi:hypothetical protein